MLADTSDIHALSAVQQGHAHDLTAVAADLSAARVASDAFGSVGAGFLAALNAALAQEARHAEHLADRLAAATATSSAAAEAYGATEGSVAQSVSTLGS